MLLYVLTVPDSLVFLRGQASWMRERGFDVHVLCSPGEQLERFALTERVTPHPVPIERRIAPFRDLCSLVLAWRVVRALQPTIVLASTPKGGLVGMLAASLARVPVRIYLVRGLPALTARPGKRHLLQALERLAASRSHRVLSVSASVRSALVAQGTVSAERIGVLADGSGNGVDARGRFDPDRVPGDRISTTRARLGIPHGDLVVGFVGRLVRDKGVIELAAAWREVAACHADAHLLIVGAPERADAVPAELLAALESDARVHFTGVVDDPTTYYRLMDLLVLPTYREGFPNVLLEAAAMRLPVVATEVPGCVDAVVRGVTGELVPAGQSGPLATAISDYLSDPVRRRAHGEAARARVIERFAPQVIWRALRDEFCSVSTARGVTLPLTEERGSEARPG